MAEIYGTVEGFKAYHDARGNSYTGTDEAILGALLRASDYIDNNYRTLFPGEKTGARNQERAWPRTSTIGSPVVDIYDDQIASDEIPVEVINATYEVALRELAQPGVMQPDVRPSDRRKQVTVEGAVSVTYADVGSIDSYRLAVTIVDGIIAPVLTGNGAMSNPLVGMGYRV